MIDDAEGWRRRHGRRGGRLRQLSDRISGRISDDISFGGLRQLSDRISDRISDGISFCGRARWLRGGGHCQLLAIGLKDGFTRRGRGMGTAQLLQEAHAVRTTVEEQRGGQRNTCAVLRAVLGAVLGAVPERGVDRRPVRGRPARPARVEVQMVHVR
jgi:hypothetical protein